MKRLVAILLCLALLPMPMPASKVRADDSDIFGASIQPNVLFLIDNSASMALGDPHVAYDPSTTYPARHMCEDLKADCLTGTVYKGMGIHPSGDIPGTFIPMTLPASCRPKLGRPDHNRLLGWEDQGISG